MLQVTLIGHLGANAEVQSYDGGKFVKMRIAHSETWKAQDGTRQSRTQWVDAVMNCPEGNPPAVLPYLTAGTQVYIVGDVRLRVYSSQKDRCMKAGLTVQVRTIELLGGKSDPIPRTLYTTDGSTMINIAKWYLADMKVPREGTQLVDKNGTLYNVDKHGWVSIPATNETGTDSETNG